MLSLKEIKELEEKQKNEPESSELIVQHNHLIEARYHLTLQEKRLMCWLASQVKQDDEDFREHELSIKDFAELLNVKGDHLYKALDLITHKLMKKIITIRMLDRKGFTKAALLGGAKYYEGQGLIHLSFHPYLKPYMLQLKESFTKISLGDVLGLKSTHAIRIYELLKQYESVGIREISLLDLREFCGIETRKYGKFSHIKDRILNSSKREINEKTDIFIDYEEIKTSRKITSIRFTIKPNHHYEKLEFEKLQSEKATMISEEIKSSNSIVGQLIDYGFTRQAVNKILKNHQEADIKNAIKAVDIQIQKGTVKNTKAMLTSAIKEKWRPDVYMAKKP